MSMKRIVCRHILRGLLTAVPAVMLLIAGGGPVSFAKVSVYDREELREALREDGRETIELMSNITVRETLTVRGTKVLTGPGELRRAVAAESAFGGSLLRVAGGTLTLRRLTIHGRGDAAVLQGKLYGWLIQVDGGQLNIGDGVVLKMNRNTTRSADGGGAVRVSGGACVMNGGLITQNANVTGGAGVRVDAGGVFTMKGGRIADNTVVGKGAVEGFDGRGGGVLNRGTAAIYGGEIAGNQVKAYHSGGKSYGGVGGGIANAGDLLLRGGTITGNSASRGRDIGQIRGRIAGAGTVHIEELWLKQNQVFHVGEGFSAATRIRVEPESLREGLKLVDGVSKKTAGRCFTSGAAVPSKSWRLAVRGSALYLEKRPVPTPTPVPTVSPGSSGGGGSGGSPATYVTPAPTQKTYPSYLPVRTADPEAEIWLHTFSPSSSPAATPTPNRMIPALPFFWRLVMTPAPTATPTMTPTPTVSPTMTPAPTLTPAPAPTPVPTSAPVGGSAWHFSAAEIAGWQAELKKEGLQETEGFLQKTRNNREKDGSIYE